MEWVFNEDTALTIDGPTLEGLTPPIGASRDQKMCGISTGIRSDVPLECIRAVESRKTSLQVGVMSAASTKLSAVGKLFRFCIASSSGVTISRRSVVTGRVSSSSFTKFVGNYDVSGKVVMARGGRVQMIRGLSG
ncbi:hypothetical protein V6N11_049244 [Hibiscus sabdariffa]|uniref:Uncharacterized protein n=1 Tax=Hibiscus sabdariffa TaxID=183260 RepID=A0ABR2P0K6_9ROSI